MNKVNEPSVKSAPHWSQFFSQEKSQPYFIDIMTYLEQSKTQGHIYYPPDELLFEAYKLTPFESIRVVIIGQDPYHGAKQAHGLAFSVQNDTPIPPSLKNIFTELNRDLNINYPKSGNLGAWAKQGVFLLNTSLSVKAGHANSHSKIGWQIFTQHTIEYINQHQKNVVFMLWGNHAKKFQSIIDPEAHHVLTSSHPSPLSAYQGFIGSSHFSLCNEYLKRTHRPPIDWKL